MRRVSRQNILIGLGLLLILGLHLALLRHYFFLTDDAFISFRYLQNWIEGHGLVFNPGEPRVEGYTNFLWIVILAPFALLHLPPENVAPALSILASLATILLVFGFPWLTRQENEIQPGWLIAPLLLALHRSFAVWASSGLETRFFTLLLFLAAGFSFRTSQNLNRRDPLYAGIFFALAELCRPEATLFWLVAVGLGLGLRRLNHRKLFQPGDAVGIAVFIGVFLIHYLGRRWYYGLWFPNTFYAKVSQSWWDMGLYYLGMFSLEYSYWMWLPLLVAFAAKSLRARIPLPAFLVLLPLPYLAYLVLLGGDHFEYRFLDPALPFLALILQECLRVLARAGRVRLRQSLLAAFTLVFLAYSTALPYASGLGFGTEYITSKNPTLDLNQAPWLYALPGFWFLAGTYKQGYQAMTKSFVGIRAEEHRIFGLRQIEQGRLFQEFIARGYLKPDESICTGSVGALPYYSRLRTLDFFGLTDAVIARMKSPRTVRAMFHDKIPFPFYLQDRNIDYVLMGNYLLRARPESLPSFNPKHRLALQDWTDRVYLLKLDSWLLMFQSPQNPTVLANRFQQRGVPIFLYLPKDNRAYAYPLSQVLSRHPELGYRP